MDDDGNGYTLWFTNAQIRKICIEKSCDTYIIILTHTNTHAEEESPKNWYQGWE